MKSTSSIFKNFISNTNNNAAKSVEQSQQQQHQSAHNTPQHHHLNHHNQQPSPSPQRQHVQQQQHYYHHPHHPHISNDMKTSLNVAASCQPKSHAINSQSIAQQSTQSSSNIGAASNNLRMHASSCSNMNRQQQQLQQQQQHQSNVAVDNNCGTTNSNSSSTCSKTNTESGGQTTTAVSSTTTASSPPSSTSYLINKMGRTYLIGYLGSAILTKGKTGLGCLQQPLRELYCIFRQSNSRLIQERRLVVSVDGLTMIYNELGIEKCLHNDLSFVYDVELLQLVCESKKDKKLYCAFIPIGKKIIVNKNYHNDFLTSFRIHIIN
jgi:hypothetical protein